MERGSTSCPLSLSNYSIQVFESKTKMNIGMFEKAREYRKQEEDKEWLKEQRKILDAKDRDKYIEEKESLHKW